MKTQLLIITLLLAFCSCTDNSEFYVSPSGNNSNPGTRNKPFQNFSRAMEAVAEFIGGGAENQEINVYFRHPMMSFIAIAAWGPIKGCNIKRNICYQSAGISEPFLKFTVADRLVSSLREYPQINSCAIDSNLYFAPGVHFSNLAQLMDLRSQGVESNSEIADPCFVGLEKAGFKLKSNSPAFKLGIKQIDYENMGLLKDKFNP